MARGRPQLHSRGAILDAARDLILQEGARAATVGAVSKASGAPKGSIYHRFASLDDLLAEMWIRAMKRSQDAFIGALADPDALSAAINAALSISEFAQRHPADARLLASLRREDLIESVATAQLRRELERLNRPLEDALAEFSRRLYGNASPEALERTVFALVDLPIGATRRHLIAGTPLPPTLGRQLAAAVRAALVDSGAGRPTRRTRRGAADRRQ